MKKWALFSFIVLSLVFTAKWLVEYQDYEKQRASQQEQHKEWTGYIKKEQKGPAIKIKKISSEDKKHLPTQEKKRSPSSTLKAPAKKIIGSSRTLSQGLTLVNDPRHDWQDVFVQNMLDLQAPRTKMFVQHKTQAYIVNQSRARSVEEVLVTFKHGDQGVNSYMAWVDSETGEIVRTWAQTHNHDFRKKAPSLVPTGHL